MVVTALVDGIVRSIGEICRYEAELARLDLEVALEHEKNDSGRRVVPEEIARRRRIARTRMRQARERARAITGQYAGNQRARELHGLRIDEAVDTCRVVALNPALPHEERLNAVHRTAGLERCLADFHGEASMTLVTFTSQVLDALGRGSPKRTTPPRRPGQVPVETGPIEVCAVAGT